MNRTVTNAILALAAGMLYLGLRAYSGHITLNDGLGPDGAPYAAMVTAHDVGAGTATNRLWPAFPIAGVIAYAVTGNVVSAFALVGGVALLLLVFAACMLLDAQGASVPIKATAAVSLGILGIPTAITAYNPVQPYLLGVAMLTFAVAACELAIWPLTAIAHLGAVLASPVGLAAPLYGLARSWRVHRRAPMELLAFAPAVVLWLLIQTWARGGPAGLFDLLRVSRVYSDAILWTEFAFMLFGAYFLVTTIGGLTVMLWSHPQWIREQVQKRTELWALLVPTLLFIATAGLDAPPMTAFLIPFWLVALAAWIPDKTGVRVAALLAGVATVVTQHPWSRITDVTYFVDWFPYSVYATRLQGISVDQVALVAVWRPRVVVAAISVIVFVLLRRTSSSWLRR